MKVIIATNNKGKIEGAKRAFEKYFEDVEVIGVSAASDVPDQPINDETFQGAKNRIKNLKSYAKENNVDADFFVAIESGMMNNLGSWMIINIAAIEDRNGIESISCGSGFPVPDKYIERIKTETLGNVMDDIFNSEDLRSYGGGISLLTHGKVSRIDITEAAFEMALTKFINGDIWR